MLRLDEQICGRDMLESLENGDTVITVGDKNADYYRMEAITYAPDSWETFDFHLI